jgi:ribosomal protein S18 acetylase RimI-like enzyme
MLGPVSLTRSESYGWRPTGPTASCPRTPPTPFHALRALGADGGGRVLVAVEDDAIVGTVMLQSPPDAGEIVTGPDEAEVRALAVSEQARGRGVGWALLRAAIERAAAQGIRHLVLCTRLDMRTAHRLYERAGFLRLPERDWTPQPDITLIAYGLRLDQPAVAPSADLA